MPQSRAHSAIEAVTNTVVGYGLAVVANMVALPLFGMHPSVKQAAGVGGVLTIVSLARQFVLRRVFNRWHT